MTGPTINGIPWWSPTVTIPLGTLAILTLRALIAFTRATWTYLLQARQQRIKIRLLHRKPAPLGLPVRRFPFLFVKPASRLINQILRIFRKPLRDRVAPQTDRLLR